MQRCIAGSERCTRERQRQKREFDVLRRNHASVTRRLTEVLEQYTTRRVQHNLLSKSKLARDLKREQQKNQKLNERCIVLQERCRILDNELNEANTMILELQDTQDGPHITPEIPRKRRKVLEECSQNSLDVEVPLSGPRSDDI